MPARRPAHFALAGLVSLALGAVLAVACNGPVGGACRYNPSCGNGELGADCDQDRQCRGGFCCDKKECDGGMCTFKCGKNDAPCPADMTCRGDVCYFACQYDNECAEGQRCKDDNFCSWD